MFVGERAAALQGLAFEGGVERFRERRCRRSCRSCSSIGGRRRPAQAAAKALDVYWAPWSVCMIARARLPRVRSAACRASMTRSVRMWSAIAQPGEAPGVQVDDGGQVEEPAFTDREIGDVADVALVDRAAAVKSRPIRSGALPLPDRRRWSGRGGVVVDPATPKRRITRATRLWLTGRPLSRSSAVIRGTP